MAPTPRVRVDVLQFDQAQADQSPVLIHALDRVTGQRSSLITAAGESSPSRAQRGQGHRLLTSTTQQLKRQTMLGLNERHRRIINPPAAPIHAHHTRTVLGVSGVRPCHTDGLSSVGARGSEQALFGHRDNEPA
jgi:hypothetical protein